MLGDYKKLISLKGPIKIKDDSLNRYFNFIDKNRKQFLSLSISEIKLFLNT